MKFLCKCENFGNFVREKCIDFEGQLMQGTAKMKPGNL